MSAKTAGYSVTHSPLGDPSGPGLWKHKGWQLPAYIQNVAKGIMKSGKDRSEAIEIAIGRIRGWATGAGNVTPEVRAASAKAIAEWEAEKSAAGGGKGKSMSVITRRRVINLAGTWDEAAHPRVAAGQTGGGEFASGSGSSSSSGSSTKTAGGKAGSKGAGAKGSKVDPAAQALWDKMSTMTPAQQAAYLASLSPAQLMSLQSAAFAPGQSIAPGMPAAQALVATEMSKRGLVAPAKAKAGAKKASTGSKKSSSGSKKSSSSGSSSGGSSGSSGSSKSSGSSGSSSKASSSKSSSAAAKAAAEKKAAAAKTAAQKKAAAAVAKAAAAQAAAAKKAAAAKTAADKKAATAAAKAAAAQAKQAAADKKAADAAAAAAAKAAAPKFASPRSAGSTSSKVGVKKVHMSSGHRRTIELVGPKGYTHGWVKADGSTDPGKLADHLSASTPGQAKKVISGLKAHELAGVDHEMSKRASALGRTGAVSKTHALVKAARKSAGKKKVDMSSAPPAIQLSYAPPAFSKGNQAPAKPAAKPADNPDPAKAPAHIPNIAALRGAMGSFGRVPPPQRAARLADIRAAAEALGASSLEWVRSFLAANGTPPRQTASTN